MILYSSSKNAFYLPGDNHPDDVVEITETTHANLIDGQAGGMLIVPNAQGRPELQPRPAVAITRDYVDTEARNRINGAYGDEVIQGSVMRYMSELTARATLGTLTDAQKADFSTLLDGATWEQQMLDRIDVICKGDLSKYKDDDQWPAPPAGLAAIVASC